VLPQLHELQDRFAARCDFLLIYVVEAHATDQWPIGQPAAFCQRQARTAAERCAAARLMLAPPLSCRLPVLCDAMDNGLEQAFRAWPLRFVIVRGDRVEWVAVPRGDMYDMTELTEALVLAAGSA
jgi:hypothetical protein